MIAMIAEFFLWVSFWLIIAYAALFLFLWMIQPAPVQYDQGNHYDPDDHYPKKTKKELASP